MQYSSTPKPTLVWSRNRFDSNERQECLQASHLYIACGPSGLLAESRRRTRGAAACSLLDSDLKTMASSYDIASGSRPVWESTTEQVTLSPSSGLPVVSRPLPQSNAELDTVLQAAHDAHLSWRKVPLAERIAVVSKAVSHLVSRSDELAREITEQMGRPIRYTKSEISTFEDRAKWLIAHAEKALADESVDEGRPEGFRRVIRRQALGVCLLVGAWNVSWSEQILPSTRS